MKLYSLEKKLFLPITVQKAWDFFSDPSNLKVITPDFMGFEVKSDDSAVMFPRQIISYTVRPVMNIPINWVTEITHVAEPSYFVDEQRFGPYKFWHHKHFINEVAGGVELIDIVHYALPFGFLGRIAHSLFVRRKLEQIFAYRTEKVKEIFK
jgi:ligand-binding SRPBCC domain-containing protein